LFFLLLLWFSFICLLSLNHIRSNDFTCQLISEVFKSICIWVQWFLNLIETLLWFYLETFMWLNEFLPLIEILLWLNFDWDSTLVEFPMDNLKYSPLIENCTLVKSENNNKLIETLYSLICKFTTIINWAIIFR